ncbi:APC family permease [Sulfurimonas sp.]|uniref:APC family permease n=1 Tax=Sulfurimonas sp. TaxID=2022749 RepID=UPI003D0EF3A1
MPDSKKINLVEALSIGIGGMVGGGIFAVLGEAVSLAHGATAIAFLIAGLVAIFTAYSYAKLSVKYQSRGGTVTFVDNAFGHNLLSGSVNLMLWLSYLVTISLYAVAFASYAQTFFTATTPLLHHILISTAIILPAMINLVSASFVGKSETFIVALKLILLVVVVIFGSSHVDMTHFNPKNFTSPISIFVAGMIIFVAYEGFELIANAAEDIENPSKNLPQALYISVGSVIVLYILIAIITVGSVDEKALLEAKDYALAIAAKPSLGELGFVLVSITALLATFSAINATIYGNARLGYIIAIDGELPTILEYKKGDTPFMGIVLTLLLSLILANTINLDEIAIIGSAGFLLIFFIVNLSALKLYKVIGAKKSVVVFSTLSSFFALGVLLYYTYQTNLKAIIIFISFVLIAIIFEVVYGKLVRGHLFQRTY